MTVLPFPSNATWVHDARGDGRAARISVHTGLVVLSVWSGDTCTATVRLRPEDVVDVVTALTQSLVELHQPGSEAQSS